MEMQIRCLKFEIFRATLEDLGWVSSYHAESKAMSVVDY